MASKSSLTQREFQFAYHCWACRHSRRVINKPTHHQEGVTRPGLGKSMSSATLEYILSHMVRVTTYGISASETIDPSRSTISLSLRENSGEKEQIAIHEDALRLCRAPYLWSSELGPSWMTPALGSRALTLRHGLTTVSRKLQPVHRHHDHRAIRSYVYTYRGYPDS